MSWFTGDDNDKYRVTGKIQGLFGRRSVTETVTGRQAGDRAARRLRDRGATDVRVSRDGWWASR